MASSEARPPQRRRRWPWVVAILLVILAAIYTGGWFWAAAWLEREARTVLASGSTSPEIACSDLAVGGYPFRMEVACSEASVANPREQVSVATGNVRAGAALWSPFTLASSVASPVTVTGPGGVGLKLDWRSLESSVRLATPLPRSVDLRLSGGSAALAGAGGTPLGTLDAARVGLEAVGRDLLATATLSGLVAAPALLPGRNLPEMDATLDLVVKDGVVRAAAGNQSLRGVTGALRQLVVASGETAAVTLAGPFEIDADGLVEATLTLTVRDAREVAKLVGGILPEQRRNVETAFAGLALMGQNAALPVRIMKGRAMLAFIPLGDIPPVE